MEAKLNQRQTEENREKNQERFSLEPITQAGEQQDVGAHAVSNPVLSKEEV